MFHLFFLARLFHIKTQYHHPDPYRLIPRMSLLQLAPLRQNGMNQSSLLADLTATPLEFGPPLLKSALVVQKGTRDVVSRGKSPTRSFSTTNGGTVNGHTKKTGNTPASAAASSPSSSPSEVSLNTDGHVAPEASSSRIPSAPPTPSRKGKEPAGPEEAEERPANAKKAYNGWPGKLGQLKRPGAGLHNPSMACYANATLQVLLHTPPVLAKALTHDPDTCRQKAKGYCMLCALRVLAVKHWTHKAYAPTEVHNNLSSELFSF